MARAQNKAAEQKALAAQIRQIITLNRQPKNTGDVAYNFVDDKKIKTLYIAPETVNHLSQGRLAIAKLDKQYEIVPQSAALKIQSRDPSFIVVCNEQSKKADGSLDDDPYADYKVPDDLMW